MVRGGATDLPARLPATLIVSAWEPETASLRRWLASAAGRARARAVQLDAAGVGPVDAGIGAARLIARTRPRRVLFVGTAGAYAGAPGRLALAVDDVAVVARAALVSTAVLRNDAYLPAPLIAEVLADPTLVKQLLSGSTSNPPAAAVAAACPLAITRSAALARHIARASGATVENLEVFAVARAAQLANLPFAAVLGIANRVGPDAHAEWKVHHRTASVAACAVVEDWLLRTR